MITDLDTVFNCSVFAGKVTFLDKVNGKQEEHLEDKIMREPCDYHRENFSYLDFPARIMKAFNYWIEASQDKFDQIHNAFEEQLIGVFLLGDLTADMDLREGKTTAHVVYGKALVLNTCFFCGLALSCVEDAKINQCMEVISKEGTKTSRLVTLGGTFAEKCICPSEEIYFKTAGYKNNLALIMAEIRLLQELYGKKPFVDFDQFVEKIRTFFTIVDECKRIAQGRTEDIQFAHFTLPVIYTVQNSADDSRILLEIIRQRTKETDLLDFAVTVVKRSGSLDYCKKKLHQIRSEILTEYKGFDKNPLLDEFFNEYLVVPDEFKDVTWIVS